MNRDPYLRLAELIKRLAGIHLNDRTNLIDNRLFRRLRDLGYSVEQYADFCEENATEQKILIDLLSTNHTHFNREYSHIDDLCKRVLALPEIANQKRIRIWSAACSSGEEPVSIAAALATHLADFDRWDIKILATDISSQIIQTAQNFEYLTKDVARLEDPGTARAFNFKEEKALVKDNIKSKIYYARLNLLDHWPMKGPFDVIFCRNVLIYFDKETRSQLVHRYRDYMEDHSTLYVGHTESLNDFDHPFKSLAPSVYSIK